jgi:hypothetical protein
MKALGITGFIGRPISSFSVLYAFITRNILTLQLRDFLEQSREFVIATGTVHAGCGDGLD